MKWTDLLRRTVETQLPFRVTAMLPLGMLDVPLQMSTVNEAFVREGTRSEDQRGHRADAMGCRGEKRSGRDPTSKSIDERTTLQQQRTVRTILVELRFRH